MSYNTNNIYQRTGASALSLGNIPLQFNSLSGLNPRWARRPALDYTSNYTFQDWLNKDRQGYDFNDYTTWGNSSNYNYQPATQNFKVPSLGEMAKGILGTTNSLGPKTPNTSEGLFGKYTKGDMVRGAIGQGVGMLGKVINKGASNDVGNTLDTLGNVAMAIPGWGTIAGVALKGLGVVANGFTDKVNRGHQRAVNSQINQIAGTTSNAANYNDLIADRKNWTTANIGKLSDWGSIGFLSSGKNVKGARNNAIAAANTAYGMRANNESAAANNINVNNALKQAGTLSAYGGPIFTLDPMSAVGQQMFTDSIMKDDNKDKKNNNMNPYYIYPNQFDQGGNLFTNGGNFYNGLTKIGVGGTHEENPNEGIQVGVDDQGTPNLVEEDELVWDNGYVFSNRLRVPRIKRGAYGKRNKYAKGGKLNKGKKAADNLSYEDKVLKPYQGLTFAEAAEKAEKLMGADERMNDPIALRGLGRFDENNMFNTGGPLGILNVLMQAQEKEREKEKLAQMQEAIDNMSPEEFAAMQQQQQMQEENIPQEEPMQEQPPVDQEMQEQIPQEGMYEQQMPQDFVPQPGMEQISPEEMLQAYGGRVFDIGGILRTNNNLYPYGGTLGEFESQLKKYGLTLEDFINYYNNSADNDISEMDEDSFGASQQAKNLAEALLARVDDIRKKYDRNLKRAGIKRESLSKVAQNYQDQEFKNIVRNSLENPNYKMNKDKALLFNDPDIKNIKSDKRRIDLYNRRALQGDLVNRKARRIELNGNKTVPWGEIAGLNRIDNSSEGFYKDLQQLNDEALANKGVYDYNKEGLSNLDDYDKLKLYGWDKDKDGNLFVNPQIYSPDRFSEIPGRTEDKYTPSEILKLQYGSDDYKSLLSDIQNQEAYRQQTDEVADAIEKALKEDGYSSLDSRMQNYLRYLDEHTKFKDKNLKSNPYLLSKDDQGNYILDTDAGNKYRNRRNDGIYGIYHYQFDRSPFANRYYYMNNGNKVYIQKPDGEGFTIGKTPTVVKDDNNGITFNDYEVTGLDKNRTLTALPWDPDAVWDVTDVEDVNNWKPLEKAPYNDDKSGLGLGINGNTKWVDYNYQGTPYNANGKDSTHIDTDDDEFPTASLWPDLANIGLQLGTLGYNIFNPIDYSNADAMLKAGQDAGKFTPIGAMFAGQQLPYKPAPNTLFNELAGANQATARNIINNSNGNIGALTGSLIGNNQAGQAAQSKADEAWRQGNWSQLKDAQTFGLQRDTGNYDRLLKADMSNQDAESKARGFQLEATKNGYALRQALKDAKDDAISKGILGLGNLFSTWNQNRYNNAVMKYGLTHGLLSSKGGPLKKIRRRNYNYNED